VSSAFAVADPENAGSQSPVNVFSLNIYRWKISASALGIPITDAQCSSYTGSISPQATTAAAQLTIDSRLAVGCKAEGSLYDRRGIPAQSIRVFLPAAADGTDREGFIVVLINSIGPDFRGTFNRAEQVLNTIRFR
jgi:hypothetical protein